MKAIVYQQAGLPLTDPKSLYDTELEKPQPSGHDLLVKIKAISVNPIDTKVRQSDNPSSPKVLGWDACGVVEAVGDSVTLFSPGDEVFYAGSLIRPGTYAEYHLVDERITGRKPATLSAAEAAALPLTSLTAWELLFDRLQVGGGQGKSLLIVGAGGGVGSILTQLASRLTGLTVIGTASRPETQQWVESLGADHVIDHRQPFSEQLAAKGIRSVDYVASLTHTDDYYDQLIEIMTPQGRLGLIDDPKALDAIPLKRKAISLHWELMFTRSLYTTEDMSRQHEILNDIASLIDNGTLRTTLDEHAGKITAASLREAHRRIETGRSRGKIVLEGF
ncbi:MAG: zinc-binding alcohol dehydrogenase family protein [Pseudomonadota bacterium]